MMQSGGKNVTQALIYEGTLDEITARYGKELFGRRLKVVAVDEPAASSIAPKPFYETATAEQWGEALRAWAASHDSQAPLLSEEAIDRESIYEGRGE